MRSTDGRPGFAVLIALACALALAATSVSCSSGGKEPRVVTREPTSTDTTSGAGSGAGARWPEVRLEEAYDGFDKPLQVTNAADGTGRLFVVEQTGRIRVIRDGKLLPEPFLDLSDKVSSGGEQGLLCLAFAPDFRESGEFYVDYTNTDGDTRVSRLRVSSDDPDRADPASEEVVLGIDQPYANHNGGQLLFDRDRYLLVGTGDGGSGGDPNGNGQSRETLLGKILRIDVGPAGREGQPGGRAYGIPAGNPYANDARFRPEIWAYGLRNPWRFSLDPETGDLYIGDVGQNAWEEIDVVEGLGRPGLNYGWNLMEGNHAYPEGSPRPPQADEFVTPVVEYGRDLGKSVTGGVVYRGSRYPDMRGMYLYADFVTGRLWGMRDALTEPETRELADSSHLISSFGYDEDGEVYVADLSGTVLRVTAP